MKYIMTFQLNWKWTGLTSRAVTKMPIFVLLRGHVDNFIQPENYKHHLLCDILYSCCGFVA